LRPFIRKGLLTEEPRPLNEEGISFLLKKGRMFEGGSHGRRTDVFTSCVKPRYKERGHSAPISARAVDLSLRKETASLIAQERKSAISLQKGGGGTEIEEAKAWRRDQDGTK